LPSLSMAREKPDSFALFAPLRWKFSLAKIGYKDKGSTWILP